MCAYSPLLTKQLKRYLKDNLHINSEWKELLDAINRSYEHYERDHVLTKRSLEISSSEMRQLISELANKEEIFRQYAENSLDVFWMLTGDLKQVVYMSPNFEKIFGFPEASIPSSFQGWSEFVHPDDRAYFLETINSISTETAFSEIDYRLQIPEKKTIWIRDRIFQVKDDNGNVYRIAGIARDVTLYKMSGLRREIRNEIIRILSQYNTLEEVVPKILSTICKALGWKIGIFWEINADNNEVHFINSWYEDTAVEVFDKASRHHRQDFGLLSKILSEHETVFFTNLDSLSFFHRATPAREAGLQDGIGFPIQLRGRNYGIIEFYSTHIDEINEKWLALFNDLSKQIGLFIERKLAEHALIASEERFRSTVEHATLGIALVSPEGRFLQINPSFAEMLGYSKEELLNKNPKEITFREDLIKETTYQNQLLAGELSYFQTEKRLIMKNKDILWTFTSCSLVKDMQGNPLYFIYEMQDISQRKFTEEKLFYLAYYDIITGLPNRRLLEDTLNQTLLLSALKNEKIAVFFIKINHFSKIKDIAGLAMADLILKEIAVRLTDRIQIKEIIGRWGEDEFVIIFSQIKMLGSTTNLLAQKILTILKDPFIIDDRKFFITAGVGVSIFPDDANQTHLLLKNANIAMNRANVEGVDNFQFYTEEMLKQAQEKILIETHLRRAIPDKELFLNFQPFIDIENSKILGVEVLLRWNSKELGPVSPAKFIPLAEENGLILSIGEWVLREGCKALGTLIKEGFPPLIFAINISALQLKEKNFLTLVSEILKETNLDPHLLRFEIVETQLIENIKESIEKINSLRQQNIQVAIDDFGIGYSSFNYLRQFSVDRFKIDASFIHNITNEPKNAAIVKAIIAMSQALGIPSIAEGVETKEECDFLKKMGCKELQGFYFSHPIAFDQLKDFISKQNTQMSENI